MSIMSLWRRLPDHLQHSVVAALFMAVVGALWALLGWSHPAIVGALVGVAFFYGREVRDAENLDAALYDRPAALWPPNWRRDPRSDFYWPLATNAALAAAIEALL